MSKILSDAELDEIGELIGHKAVTVVSGKAANAAISRQQGIIDGQALRIEDYEKRLSPTEGADKPDDYDSGTTTSTNRWGKAQSDE